jgi:hypothetical protein
MPSPIAKSIASIESKTSRRCDIALILGSGLGSVADELVDAISIPYEDIAGFPVATTAGHAGRLILGDWRGQQVAVLQGRMHLYEGWQAQEIALPVRVMRHLGANYLVVTNAAGALNPEFQPGQIMLIEDHLNFTGTDPLIGPNNDAIGLRFPDMSRAYDPDLRQLATTRLSAQGLEFGPVTRNVGRATFLPCGRSRCHRYVDGTRGHRSRSRRNESARVFRNYQYGDRRRRPGAGSHRGCAQGCEDRRQEIACSARDIVA